MTGAEIIAEIRLLLDKLEKTLQADKPKQQAAENMICDPCPSCGREIWTKTQPTKNGGVYYRKICSKCELEHKWNDITEREPN